MTQDLREALEAQIAEWRDMAEPCDRETMGWYHCANDIEELLQEHQE